MIAKARRPSSEAHTRCLASAFALLAANAVVPRLHAYVAPPPPVDGLHDLVVIAKPRDVRTALDSAV